MTYHIMARDDDYDSILIYCSTTIQSPTGDILTRDLSKVDCSACLNKMERLKKNGSES